MRGEDRMDTIPLMFTDTEKARLWGHLITSKASASLMGSMVTGWSEFSNASGTDLVA